MREEWQAVEGGKPNLLLWPETPAEAELTAAEAELLRATLADEIRRDPRVERQIAAARVSCREFSNYGFFVMMEVPSQIPAATAGVLGRGTGFATLGFKGSSRRPLMTVTFSSANRLEILEGYPSDGAGWSIEECIAILRSPVCEVEIVATRLK